MARVTFELGGSTAAVRRYATDHGLSLDDAALALVREALTAPRQNSVSGTVNGRVIQAGDIRGDVKF